jgi:hypothetical protein
MVSRRKVLRGLLFSPWGLGAASAVLLSPGCDNTPPVIPENKRRTSDEAQRNIEIPVGVPAGKANKKKKR